VVKGVVAREEIDARISEKLAEGWRLDRLDKTMVQILRAGTYELLARDDVAGPTVINEYVDVAHAFSTNAKPSSSTACWIARAAR
jgi:N utilization substance protein B